MTSWSITFLFFCRERTTYQTLTTESRSVFYLSLEEHTLFFVYKEPFAQYPAEPFVIKTATCKCFLFNHNYSSKDLNLFSPSTFNEKDRKEYSPDHSLMSVCVTAGTWLHLISTPHQTTFSIVGFSLSKQAGLWFNLAQADISSPLSLTDKKELHFSRRDGDRWLMRLWWTICPLGAITVAADNVRNIYTRKITTKWLPYSIGLKGWHLSLFPSLLIKFQGENEVKRSWHWKEHSSSSFDWEVGLDTKQRQHWPMEDFYFKIVSCFVATFERDAYDVLYQNSNIFLGDRLPCAKQSIGLWNKRTLCFVLYLFMVLFV